jgi:hypothetical protein
MVNSISAATRASRRDVDEMLTAFLASCGLALQKTPALPAPERWAALLPTLRAQRLRPIAYWVARQSDFRLSPGVGEELKSAFYVAAVHHERLRFALAEIEDVFCRGGIPLVVLKGLSLAGWVYPDPACRPMDDIDLLVKPEHLQAASQLLTSLGYSDKIFGIEDFRNPATGIVVDLHAELLNTTRFPVRRAAWCPDLDAWWNRTRFLPSHTHVRSLHPHDHLVYLCHHAWLHHGLRKSLGLVDVCLLLRKIEADVTGESVLQREDIGAARRGLWYALLSCQHRYGHALPDTLQRNLRPNNTGPFERMIHALAVRGRLPEAARYGYLWLTIPSRDRVHFLRQFLSASRNAAGVGICQGASHQAP